MITGILRVADRTQLDREIEDMHTFNVLATDRKGRSAVGTVTVTVLDINDQPPSFDHAIFNFTIPEDAAGGQCFLFMVFSFSKVYGLVLFGLFH